MSPEVGYAATVAIAMIALTAIMWGSMRAVGMAGYYQDRGEVAPVRNVVRGAMGIVVAGASPLAMVIVWSRTGVFERSWVAPIAVAAAVAIGALTAAIALSGRLFSYPPLPRAGVSAGR